MDARQGWVRAAIAVLALGLAGCATDAQLRKLDKRFDRGWRPGKAYCLWGGETPKIDAYCARLNFGFEGELTVLNGYVIDSLPRGTSAEVHAKAVLAAVREIDGLKADLIYSFPEGSGVMPHVSVIVIDPSGKKWVLDNRAVISPADGVSGVAPLREFAALVGKEYWVGRLPADRDVFAQLEEIDPSLLRRQ